MQTVACTEFGTFLGRRSERLLVRTKKSGETEIPLFRIGEIVVPARGVSLSGEIIEAACERGIPARTHRRARRSASADST